MPRKITVTFEDGSQHVYENAPDDITPEQVTQRASEEFGLSVTSLDGGRPAVKAPAPVMAPSSPAPAALPEARNPTPLETGTGVVGDYTLEAKDNPEAAAIAESLWAQGVRDPAVYNRELSKAFGDGNYNQFDEQTVARVREREAYYKALNQQTPGLFIATESTGEKNPERPDGIVDTVLSAAGRGAGQVYNSGVGLAALGADVVGADEAADSLLEEYILNNAKMQVNLPRPVDTYSDVDSFGDAGLYALDTLGELAPQLVGSLGAGYLGKEAAKKVVAKSVDEMVEQQVASGVAREVAEQAAKKAIDKAAQRGATAGIMGSTITQETGNTFGSTYQKTGVKAPALSVAAGIVSGSLDAILPGTVFKNLSLPQEIIKTRLAREVAKQGSKGFVIEGATEAAQEFVTSLPSSVITGESPFTEEMLDKMTEAFIRGGIGGGTTNVSVAGINAVRVSTPEAPAPKLTDGGTIVVPSARRGSKEYKKQLGSAQDQVISVVNEVARGWTNSPSSIEVHQNFKDVQGIDDNALGVYTEDGKVMINTEAVLARAKKKDVSPESVVQAVVFHEALGHHGLTQRWGQDLDTVLDTIYENGTEQLRDLVDTWIKNNPDDYLGPNQRVRATEEVLAEWSEKNGVLPKRIYDTIANKIKNFARDMGMNKLRIFKDSLGVSEREVKAYLAVAQRRVTQGDPTGNTPGVAKNMVVFHGKYDLASLKEGLERAERVLEKELNVSDKFNYVVFDDKTPKITAKYMRGDGPINEEDLSADDIISAEEAGRAIELLDRVLDNYQPSTAEMDDIYNDLAARGVPPSAVLRLSGIEAGDLVRRRKRYDIAAGKLYDRNLRIQDEIQKNGMTDELAMQLLKADIALQSIAEKTYNLESEFGRVLNEQKRMKFTRKKAKNFREFLKNYPGMEHLNDPEQFAKYMAARKEAIEKDRRGSNEERYAIPFAGNLSVPRRVFSVFNLPRALMSSMDLSAPLRQGIVMITHPSWWSNFVKMFSYLGPSGKTNYDFMMKKITTSQNYQLMVEGRLGFSDLDGKLSQREEDFQSDLARKIPFVKSSEQAYAGFLNKLRADVFNSYVEALRQQGVLELKKVPRKGPKDATEEAYIVSEEDRKILQDLGKFINSATGRADLLPSMRSMGVQLNSLFFSPRLIQSRVNMMAYTIGGGNLNYSVRKAVWRHMFGSATVIALVLGLISNFTDWEVETDPRSSQFAKIKVADTYYDITGGFGQYFSLAAQSSLFFSNYSGATDMDEIKSSSGKTRRLGGDGKYDETYPERLWRFARGKLSPNVSFAVDAAYKENIVGQPFTLSPIDTDLPYVLNPDSSTLSRMMPMHISSAIDAANEYQSITTGVGMTLPGLLGVGVNTYTPVARNPNQTLDAADQFKGEKLTTAQQEWWKGTLNNHFKALVTVYTVETGYSWEALPEKTQEEIISLAKEEAKKFTREDAELSPEFNQ